ncbi:MAG: response regulator [Lachnospira sp.]|nr:response regulator [Lachnospira sp.]
MKERRGHIMDSVQHWLVIILIGILALFLLGQMLLPNEHTSSGGECAVYNGVWERVMPDGSRQAVEVPGEYEAAWKDVVVLESVLEGVKDDTWFCIRSTQQDYRIYVGDELRQEYTNKEVRLFGRNSPDAYVFFRVYEEDMGKVLRIESQSDSTYSGYLNTVYMGEKDAIWGMYFSWYLPGVLISVFIVILSLVVVIACAVLRVFYKKKMDIVYLGMGVLIASVWLVVESKLRQLVLPNSFVSTATGFYMIMLLPFPFSAYMNRIQKRRYETAYMIINIGTLINFLAATVMQLTGFKDFFETMGASHVIIVSIMVFMILTVGIDIKKGYIKDYLEVATGLGAMVVAGVMEIYLVYQKGSGYNGISLCLGLVIMLFTALLKTGRDILETEKAKQKAIIASESKTKFLANMSHEIRTPINTVIGMNEMILRENKDENINEYARNINSASRMLLNLINDVLDFAKIESGKVEITETKYYVSSMLNDVILGTKVRAEKKNLLMDLDIDEDIPSVLMGDEFRIKQILNNLLSNAVKYTEKGKIILKISSDNSDGFKLIMAVRDTGIGIRKEDMQKLFDSFKRLELKKNRYIEGTGLGLSITKQLVEQMGGTIEVESEYGKGSCFTVTIPQKVVDETPMGDLKAAYKRAGEEKQDVKEPLYAPNASVLVVDDNNMNLMVIKGLLKRSEIKLDFASGGTESLEMCKNKKYDLILMDHMMPEPDGVETLHMLRADKESVNKDTTVIVLTANAIAGAEEEYIREGFADYITKPVEVEKLETTLKKYLL